MATKKTTLTIAELYALDIELSGNGLSLTNQRLSLVVKYHLTHIAKLASQERADFDKLRNELIISLGEKQEDDTYNIPEKIVSQDPKEKNAILIVNPNLAEFKKQLEALLTTTKEIEHYEFDLNEFSAVQTEGNYPVFYKILGLE